MALGSTQPLTEMRAFPGGKGGRCVKLTTLPPSCAVVMKSGNLNFLEPSGPLRDCFTFLYDSHFLFYTFLQQVTSILTRWSCYLNSCRFTKSVLYRTLQNAYFPHKKQQKSYANNHVFWHGHTPALTRLVLA